MKIVKLKDLSDKDYSRIIRRSFGGNEEIFPEVIKIINQVRKEKDEAIMKRYQARFGEDRYSSIAVTRKEMNRAYNNVGEDLIKALEQMIKNINLVHKAQLPRKKDTVVCSEEGISVWREWRPIERVGLYIPAGKAVYPSSVLMSVIPAQIAGCREIILCSPPKIDGQIHASILVATNLLGLTKIYKVGGVAAIASMAYGTQSLPKVYKIFGAGGSFVTAAKILVSKDIAIDMPAGPSEIFVIADETADPCFIAADLLADGEHGNDSSCVLLTTSDDIAKETLECIQSQLKTLDTAERIKRSLEKYGLFAIVDSLDEAVDFANDYAPEHLTIMTRNPEELVEKITNAGSVFLGSWTSKSSGDYATGANHVLPTGGMAKMYPPLSVEAYGKWMQIQKCTKNGLSRIRRSIDTISRVEKLPAHRLATFIRFQKRRS